MNQNDKNDNAKKPLLKLNPEQMKDSKRNMIYEND
jgi:hypothetical protein